jgi:hypothetical protein
MQFSEDDLRSALRPKDPGPEFTQRVMARVNQQEHAKPVPAISKTVNSKTWWSRLAHEWLAPSGWRPAIVGAMAVVLMVTAAWIGIERYQSYIEQVRNQKVQEELQARNAEQQAVRALRITSAKLNHVFQKINGMPSSEPKIRRQSL